LTFISTEAETILEAPMDEMFWEQSGLGSLYFVKAGRVKADETRTRCYHASFGSERVYIAERVVYC